MRLYLKCGYTKYNKCHGLCPMYNNSLIQVDSRLRKVVESLAKSEYQIAFAYCKTYTVSEMYTAEILIGLVEPYDKFIFQGLPEHFEFVSDKYGNQAPYTLNYVLNHIGQPMSMIMYDYCNHPDRSEPVAKVLKEDINNLYKWAMDIQETAKWAVYKLGGYI